VDRERLVRQLGTLGDDVLREVLEKLAELFAE
jgi:mRNA-degrading endonuclease toxin of MazEF toxin-antitoxin module